MFIDVEAFKAIERRPNRLVKYEHSCSDCGHWTDVTALTREHIRKDYVPKHKGYRMRDFVCSKCKRQQLLTLPGKYDRSGARRPIIQRFVVARAGSGAVR